MIAIGEVPILRHRTLMSMWEVLEAAKLPPPSRIFTSPMLRAVETANFAAGLSQAMPAPHVTITNWDAGHWNANLGHTCQRCDQDSSRKVVFVHSL